MRAWYLDLSSWEILGYSAAVAFVLQWIVGTVFLRLAQRTKTDLDQTIVKAIHLPVFLTLLFGGVYIALKRWDPAFTEVTLERATAIMITLAAFIWMRALRRVADAVCDALGRNADRFNWIQPQSVPLYEIVSSLMIIGAGVYVVLLAWEIDLTAWLASAGIIGIAVGFAARDTLANLFAGMFILADAPYKLGDFIILGGGERGQVTGIGIRSTRILTRDHIEITIPNSVIANSKIVNETGGPQKIRRVRVNVGVAYGSDIDRVREILMEVARDAEYAAEDPPPSVRFKRFGDSSLDFELRVWVERPILSGRSVDQINTAIYKRFNAEGIEIPFPQRVVHMTGQ